MRNAVIALALIALLPLTGCGGAGAGRATGDDPQNARFRARALDAYRAITMEACGPRPLRNHTQALAPEIAAVRALEAEVKSTPAAAQLAIARADAEYVHAANPSSCWMDYGKAEIADLHVKMAREQVTEALRALRGLARGLPAKMDPGLNAPANAAEFRASARELIEWVTPPCQIVATEPNDVIVARAMAEVERLRSRLAASPYGIQLAIAEGDIRDDRATVQYECGDPGNDSGAVAGDALLAEVKPRIAQLLTLAGL